MKLGLELCQLVVDAFEGCVRNLPTGRIHVPLGGIPAGSSFRMWRLLKRGRRGWREGPPDPRRGGWRPLRRRTSRCGGRRIRDDGVAGCAGVRGCRSYLAGDLLHRYDEQVLFFRLDAVIVFIEVEDEWGEVRGFLSDDGEGSSNDFVDEQPLVHRPDSRKSLEQGVGHREGDPLRFFRIEDRH